MTDLPRYLQLLWDREPEGRRGPKPGRSIAEIGAAAVAIADTDGLDAVSMKSVATSVGFTTMSLYRYLDSKDELYAVMVDVAYGAPDVRYRADWGWRARITEWAREISARRLAHPWTVEAPQTSPPLTPNMIGWMESGLEALEDAPLTSQQRLSALLAIDGWGQNHVRQTIQMGLAGPVDPDSPQGAYLADHRTAHRPGDVPAPRDRRARGPRRRRRGLLRRGVRLRPDPAPRRHRGAHRTGDTGPAVRTAPERSVGLPRLGRSDAEGAHHLVVLVLEDVAVPDELT